VSPATIPSHIPPMFGTVASPEIKEVIIPSVGEIIDRMEVAAPEGFLRDLSWVLALARAGGGGTSRGRRTAGKEERN
jgi:hypothetical protein